MKLQSNSLAALAAVLALCLATPLPAAAEVTEAQIAAARTPADHEAIATAYEADAATADAKAKEHEAMARTYRSTGGPKCQHQLDGAALRTSREGLHGRRGGLSGARRGTSRHGERHREVG